MTGQRLLNRSSSAPEADLGDQAAPLQNGGVNRTQDTHAQQQEGEPHRNPHEDKIRTLEAENKRLQVALQKAKLFRIADIAEDDKLVTLYTGLPSYEVFLFFFQFLGPASRNLNYVGSKSKGLRHRETKLDPLNQLF